MGYKGNSLQQLFDSWPRDLWKSPGHRQFALIEWNQVQRDVAAERFDGALHRLQRLREGFDGCARAGAADNDDLIRDCETQRVVRELLDRAAADLEPR